MTQFTRAIARRPAANFAGGLTTSSLGSPDFERTLEQHARYCDALRDAGVAVTMLEPDDRHPDSTFVEDTAIVARGCAIVTRPGAASRLGEAAAMREPLSRFFSSLAEIEAPGTVDGGDVCEADARAFIGLSHRTNRSGAEQLAAWFAINGISASIVDIRDIDSILHFKSGVAYVGDGCFVAIDELIGRLDIPRSSIVATAPDEEYGANCVRVNDVVLVASGHPHLERDLAARGFTPVALDMSEYQKMDGGLSCLSIRF
jgi:dimethylargininase